MWKLLDPIQKVCTGDKVRYINTPFHDESPFEVVKTDRHYFEIMPLEDKCERDNYLKKKIVRYFDIGYYIGMEVWINS